MTCALTRTFKTLNMKPQPIRLLGSVCLLLAGSLFFTSCKKGTEGGGQSTDNSLTAVLKNRADLTNLVTALERTGLDTVLSKKADDFTIFAPNNDAFAAAGITESSIATMDVNKLNRLLQYHILAKKMTALEFPISDTVKTMADTVNL